MTSEQSFFRLLTKNNLTISNEQADIIRRYVTQLSEWNKKINLVSRKDEEKIWTRHILGSIFFLFAYDLHEGSSILDLGTGGGLPGIPLAVLYPKNQFVLVDSIQKKISAVSHMIETLELPNVKAICTRAENMETNGEPQIAFDYVISRGVAATKDIIKWGRPLLRPSAEVGEQPQGKHSERNIIPRPALILLKGGELSQELEQARIKMKPKHMEVHQIAVNGLGNDELIGKKIVIVQP